MKKNFKPISSIRFLPEGGTSKQFVSIVGIITILIASMVSTGSLVYVVYASPNGSTLYVEEGIYPGPANYTIWKDGSTYYAKDANGHIVYQGSNATAIIQNCYNNLNEGTIRLSSGRYIVDSIFPSNNSCLEGEGWSTVLQLRDSADTTIIQLPNHARNVTIKNLALDGNMANQNPSYPVFLVNTSNAIYCNFIELDLYGSYGGGLKIFGYSYSNLVLGCWIHDNGETGTAYSNGLILDDHAGRNVVQGNRIYNNYKDGIMCDSLCPDNVISGNVIWGNQATGIGIFSAASGWESIGLTISGNVITDNSWHGIDVNGYQKGITITGNTITYNRRMGIDLLNSNYTLISGNTIAYNSIDNAGTYNGITIDSSYHSTIVGNQIYDDESSPTQKWGIEEIYDSPQADYNTIIGNNCFHNNVGGIRIYGGNTHVNLCWNGTSWVS